MKKILAIVLLAITVFALGACNDDNKDFSFGLVTDTSGVEDRSFNQGVWDGMEEFGKEKGLVEGEGYRNVQTEVGADTTSALQAYADEELDLIIAAGYTLRPYLMEAAKNNKDSKFLLIDEDPYDYDDDNNKIGDYNNAIGAVFAEHEGSFLAGVAAAEHAKANGKNTVGFIGGDDYFTINKFHRGFYDGVKHVDPNMTVLSGYIGTFVDETKGKAEAVKMYNSGAYTIYVAAGPAGNGVISEAKERNLETPGSAWVVGVDIDQYTDGYYDNARTKSCVLTSMIKDTSVAVQDVLEKLYKGEFEPGVITYGLEDGGVRLPENNPNLSQDIIDKVATAKAGILDGTITVNTAKPQ